MIENSSMYLDDVEKAIKILKKRGKKAGIKGLVSVESASCLVGKPKKIINYLLRSHFPDYKLVKRTHK